MHYHVEIWTSFRFLLFSTFIKYFPSLFFKIKCIHVGHVSGFLRDITTVNDHFVFEYDSWVGIYLWNCDVRTDFLPFLFFDVVGKDQITRKNRWNLSSKQINSVFMYYWSVRLQFDRLSIALIIEFDPKIFLSLLWNIHTIKVSKHTFISIKASVNIKMIWVNSRCMIGSRCYIFSLNFNFCPPRIKGVL